MIRIAHLSDFHLDNNQLFDMDKFVMEALKRDLKIFNDQKKIDLIVFSGDLIDKGGESFDNSIELAFRTFEEKVIEPIMKEIGLPKERFFIVPGNHDIKRNADEDIEEIGLLSKLNSTEKVNSFIDSEKQNGIRRILFFKKFEKYIYKDFKEEHKLTNYHSCFKIKTDGLDIGITCFNSAWRCYDSKNDKGRLLLGERQVINAREVIKDCDIKIAIIHHPLDYLSDFDSNCITSFIERDYDMIFCGHNHEGNLWSKTGLYGKLFISVGPSNWTYNLRSTDRNNANGYTIIDYEKNSKVIGYSRRYSHKKECFDPNTDLGDQDGCIISSLPDTEDLGRYNKEIQVTEIIRNMHFEKVNEHLLSYNTDTKAPKDLDEIFVFPHLVRKIEYDIEKLEEKNIFDLEELCTANENILIFGSKESGKTILLDKVLIELTNNIRKYHKLAVYFDFNDIENRRFETIINNFIGIGIRNIQRVLDEHTIVLLIDNFDFNKLKLRNLNRLEEFIKINKKTRIIATCNQLIEGEIPLDAYKYNSNLNFNMVFIKYFQTKHTRELMQKWFSKNKIFNFQEKINKLVGIFYSLELPWTPMAISIFLWIIEQQEDYKPINNATMLENFIERLFKKWSKNEIYSESFDYRNKERLLSDIAYTMFKKNSLNYSMSYSELLDFIINYLKRKKFDFSGDDLLQHFLSKGILIKEISETDIYIRFRFNCFFQFFLTKKMVFDADFKNFVLSEENMFKFIYEIDYFTGLKRDQSDILKLLIEKMELEYNEAISLFSKDFDNICDIKKSLSSDLSNEKIINELKGIEKPKEADFEKIIDEMIDSYRPNRGIEKKEEILDQIPKLEAILILAAKVLKNTEECEEQDLKDYSYKRVLVCSMVLACITFVYIEELSKQDLETDDETKLIKILLDFRKYLPLLVQSMLHYLMGTGKLSVVIREKLDKDLVNKEISDFEKFISVFLYADINGKDNLKYIRKFIKGTKKQYIYDNSLIKILNYYFLQSKDKNTDKEYEKLIAENITHSKGFGKIMKSTIMTDYRNRRKKYLSQHIKQGDFIIKL